MNIKFLNKIIIITPSRRKKKAPLSWRAERYIDRHNHKLEAIRTLGTIITIFIALRVFGVI
jgi:hypothetical protein